MTSTRRPRTTASRGELWLVDRGYAGKVCSGLVLSFEPLNSDRALVTLIPHPTSPRGTRFEVDLRTSFLKPGAIDAQNPITLPQAKLMRPLGVVTANELA